MATAAKPQTAAKALTAALPPSVRLLDRDVAAAALGVSVRMLDQLDADGEGPATVRVGRRRLYAITAIEQWIRERVAAGE